MEKKGKKLIALLIVSFMAISSIPSPAFAVELEDSQVKTEAHITDTIEIKQEQVMDDEQQFKHPEEMNDKIEAIEHVSENVICGEYRYVLNEDGSTITITEYMGNEVNVEFPAVLDGYKVTRIAGKYIMEENKNVQVISNTSVVKKIVIPNSVKTIGAYAFKECPNLENVYLPKEIVTVEENAFDAAVCVTFYGESGNLANGSIPEMEKRECTVTLVDVENAIQKQIKVCKGEVFDTLPLPVKKGYTFEGWYTEKEAGKKIDGTIVCEADCTLYARWKENQYMIVFNGNGATTGVASEMKCLYSSSYSLNKNPFERDGYRFLGWNTKEDGTGRNFHDKENIQGISNEDAHIITLYAQWEKMYIAVENIALNPQKTHIDVFAKASSHDKNPMYRYLQYDLGKKQWTELCGWTNNTHIVWEPSLGQFWIQVQAKTADGIIADRTVGFDNNIKDYSEKNLDLMGICYEYREQEIAVGVAYESNDLNVEFRWKQYNLVTGAWAIISDWNPANWSSWKPKKGNYWLVAEARLKNNPKISKQYVICFSVNKDYSDDYLEIIGICYEYRSHDIAVGVAYESNTSDVEIRWQQYDLEKSEWKVINDWNTVNWSSWKPKKGNYWLVAEVRLKNHPEITKQHVICFATDKDYSKDHLVIEEVVIDEKSNANITLDARMNTNVNNVKYSWLVYNVEKKEWHMLVENSMQSKIQWEATNGIYLLCMRATTESGMMAEKFCGYEVKGRTYLNVGKDSLYQNINSAIAYGRTIASSTNRVIIKIAPGEYNEHISLRGADYIDLLGTDPSTTVIKSELSYPYGCMYINGTHHIENITFKATGFGAYAIHYETEGDIVPGMTKFRNCILHANNAPGAGIGLSANATVIFEACHIISDSTPGLYFHNNIYSNRENQNLKFIHCKIIAAGNIGIRIDDAANSHGNSNSKVELTFRHCSCNVQKLEYRKNTHDKGSYISYIPRNDSAFYLTKESMGNTIEELNYKV